MRKSVFSKVIFCLVLAVGICSLGSVCAEPVRIMNFSPPDWESVIKAGSPVMAMAGLAIPACDLKDLKCVTQEAFSGLQVKFGKLYVIDVKIGEDESYQFLLRRPTRQHLEIIQSYKGDVTKVNDFTIKNLVVAGNEQNALDDGIVFTQFNAEAGKILRQAEAFLSKA